MQRIVSRNLLAVILWLLAILFFIMYAFDWHISDFDRPEQLGLGLALFVAGCLVPE